MAAHASPSSPSSSTRFDSFQAVDETTPIAGMGDLFPKITAVLSLNDIQDDLHVIPSPPAAGLVWA
ncbi:MAG: hypothetical protein C4293_05375 [Nitrospiraceae bacterium]